MELDEEKLQPVLGRKRPPEDELTGEQRLAKRFHFLNLENARQLYFPPEPRPQPRRKRSNAVSDSMRLDDSKHRTYIDDLDAELDSGDSEEEKLVFLPDIEKRLANLPRSVLTTESAPKGNEVVLYNVPESLSVPREHDSVRKAIIESRKRARDMQMNGDGDTSSAKPSTQQANGAVPETSKHTHTPPNVYDDDIKMEVD